MSSFDHSIALTPSDRIFASTRVLREILLTQMIKKIQHKRNIITCIKKAEVLYNIQIELSGVPLQFIVQEGLTSIPRLFLSLTNNIK